MLLTAREREHLLIHTVAVVALERDGRTKDDLQDAGRTVLGRGDVMEGVPGMLAHVHAVDPDRFRVTIDGSEVDHQPQTESPMTERYLMG